MRNKNTSMKSFQRLNDSEPINSEAEKTTSCFFQQSKEVQNNSKDHLVLQCILLLFIFLFLYFFNFKSQNTLSKQQKNYLISKYYDHYLSQMQESIYSEEPGLNLEIKSLQIDLNYLKNQNQSIQCRHLNIYDDFNQEDRSIYYLGAYDLFLKSCNQKQRDQYGVHNQNIQQWNARRDVIEWSLRNLAEGDRVYLNLRFNLLTLIIVSRIVGKKGLVSWAGLNLTNTCLVNNIQLYSIDNIEEYTNQDLKNFNVFIGESDKLPKIYGSILQSNNYNFKLFYFLGNPTSLKYLTTKAKIHKYVLNNQKCGSPSIIAQIKETGFYSITNLEHNFSLNAHKQISLQNKIFLEIKNNYKKYIQDIVIKLQKKLNQLLQVNNSQSCINPKKDRHSGNFQVLTLYGTTLFNISQDVLKQWEKERQPIQWLRSFEQNDSKIFLKMKQPINLFVAISIARIIKNGTLIIACNDFECDALKIQKDHYSLKNIQITKITDNLFDKAIISDYIITDDTVLIGQLIKKQVQTIRMLIKFNQTDPNFKQVFGSALAAYQLNQIRLFSNCCQGIQKEHYFWSSDKISYFYQAKPSKRYIFMFWSGMVSTIPFRRKHFLKQAISNSKVEVKIVNDKILYLLENNQFPIHQSYNLLSEIHKSDYARAYLMHIYGGGYIDTKHQHFDWNPYFSQLQDNPDLYAVGYHQIRQNDVGCFDMPGQVSCSQIRKQFKKIIGNGQYIYRKNTPGTSEVILNIHNILDNKSDLLQKFHPIGPRDKGPGSGSLYPLRWPELNGQLRARACYRYLNKYKLSMPFILSAEYRELQ